MYAGGELHVAPGLIPGDKAARTTTLAAGNINTRRRGG